MRSPRAVSPCSSPNVAALCACCWSRFGSTSGLLRSFSCCTLTGALGGGERPRLSQDRSPVGGVHVLVARVTGQRAPNPARDAQRAAGTRASALTRRVVACGASAPLLRIDGAKTCFCPLAGSLELAHSRRAGGPLSVGLGLGLVQVVALAGVLSLCSQIVRVPGGHAAGAVTACGGRSAVRRGVSRGRVGVRSRCWAVCS